MPFRYQIWEQKLLYLKPKAHFSTFPMQIAKIFEISTILSYKILCRFNVIWRLLAYSNPPFLKKHKITWWLNTNIWDSETVPVLPNLHGGSLFVNWRAWFVYQRLWPDCIVKTLWHPNTWKKRIGCWTNPSFALKLLTFNLTRRKKVWCFDFYFLYGVWNVSVIFTSLSKWLSWRLEKTPFEMAK